ncbi:MAG: SIMPL domain-containing protein [Capsulimonadaceae bacterium]|nr:SIMPL domain-containing protein [Capsulimonadaceae bacterium]
MATDRFATLLPALIVALGLFVAAGVLGGSIGRARSADETIRVNGTARRIVHSDYIIWDAEISYQAPTVADAYASLQQGSATLRAYLAAHAVRDSDVFPLAIKTNVLYEKTQPSDNGSDETVYRTIKGYRLSQIIEVRSNQVQTVEAVSRSATELIKQGVALGSNAPQYRITNLADEKDSILAEAAKNARERAERIAVSSGARLGKLRWSHMGAMSVTGAYADEQTDGGAEDTESIDKRVTVMVTAAYEVK